MLQGTIGPGGAGPRGGLNALDPNDPNSDAGLQNRNSYGGHLGGAQEAIDRYRNMGQGAANRGAYQPDYGQLQYGQGQARDAMGLERSAALGATPSQAEIAGHAAMDQSLQNQVAAAGSARGGPAATAAAYRNAARTGAANEATMTAGIQAGRAGEMAQARGAYGQMALGYGNQALGQTGQQIQNEQFQRGLNQQGQQFYEGMGQQTNLAQLQANQNAQQVANAQFAGNQGVRQGDEGLNLEKVTKYGGMAIGAGATGGAAAAAAARGGPVKYGQPYLVGEEGPELVIPKQDSTVIPAAATASLLGGHTPGHRREEGGEMSTDAGFSGERSGPRESREPAPPAKDAEYYANAQVAHRRERGDYASDPSLYEPIAQPAARKPDIFEGVEAPDYKPRPETEQAADKKAAVGASKGGGKMAGILGALGSASFNYAMAPPSRRYEYNPNAYGLGQTHPVSSGQAIQPMAMPVPARAEGGFMPAGGDETGMTSAGYMPGLQYAEQNKAMVNYQHHAGSPGGSMMGGPMAFHMRAMGGPMQAGGAMAHMQPNPPPITPQQGMIPPNPIRQQATPPNPVMPNGAPPPPPAANPYTTPYGGMAGVQGMNPRLQAPPQPIAREEGGEMNAFGLGGHDTREAPINLGELVDPTPETPKRVLDQRAAGARGAGVSAPRIATSTGTGHGTPGPTTATFTRPGPTTVANKETFPSREERRNRRELEYGVGK